MSVLAVQVRLIPLDETAVAVRPVGTDGAVVSGTGVWVVALAELDAADVFPAASYAETVYAYAVEPVSPVSE